MYFRAYLIMKISALTLLFSFNLKASNQASVSIGGQFGLDYQNHLAKPDGADFTNGANLRTADLYVTSNFNDSVSASLDLHFDPEGVELGTAFVRISKLLPMTDILIGQIPTPFHQAHDESRKYSTFFEQASIAALYPDMGPGLSIQHSHRAWSLEFAFVAPKLGAKFIDPQTYKPISTFYEKQNDQYAFILRGTGTPILSKMSTLHLGLSVTYEGEGYRFPGFTEVYGRNVPKVLLSEESKYVNLGLELSYQYGPVLFESKGAALVQFAKTMLGDKTPLFYGLETGLSWIITGQNRSYDTQKGEFLAINRENVGNFGVWDLGIRYSRIGWIQKENPYLDESINNINFALNWSPTAHMKFGINYLLGMVSNINGKDQYFAFADPKKIPTGTLSLRAQVLF